MLKPNWLACTVATVSFTHWLTSLVTTTGYATPPLWVRSVYITAMVPICALRISDVLKTYVYVAFCTAASGDVVVASRDTEPSPIAGRHEVLGLVVIC